MKMIDVGEKARTAREARARGRVLMEEGTRALALGGRAEKGDVLAAARLAGVMAAKRTPDLVPLCHPIALTGVDVEISAFGGGLEVEAAVRTTDRTGVEMEALAAVCAACLTIYDMLKRYERGMRIEGVELLEKYGGRSGHWRRAEPAPAVSSRRRSARAGRAR